MHLIVFREILPSDVLAQLSLKAAAKARLWRAPACQIWSLSHREGLGLAWAWARLRPWLIGEIILYSNDVYKNIFNRILVWFSSLLTEQSQQKWAVALSWWEEWTKEYLIGNNMLHTRNFSSCEMFRGPGKLPIFGVWKITQNHPQIVKFLMLHGTNQVACWGLLNH